MTQWPLITIARKLRSKPSELFGFNAVDTGYRQLYSILHSTTIRQYATPESDRVVQISYAFPNRNASKELRLRNFASYQMKKNFLTK